MLINSSFVKSQASWSQSHFDRFFSKLSMFILMKKLGKYVARKFGEIKRRNKNQIHKGLTLLCKVEIHLVHMQMLA